MARPKKKPAYDAEKIMKDLMAAVVVVESYGENGELRCRRRLQRRWC